MNKLIFPAAAFLMASLTAGCTMSEGISSYVSSLSDEDPAEVAVSKDNLTGSLASTARTIADLNNGNIQEAFNACDGARAKECDRLGNEWDKLVSFYDEKKAMKGPLFVCDGPCMILNSVDAEYESGRDTLGTESKLKVETTIKKLSQARDVAALSYAPAQYIAKIRDCRLETTTECDLFVADNKAHVAYVRGERIGMSSEACGEWCKTHGQIDLILTLPESRLRHSETMIYTNF